MNRGGALLALWIACIIWGGGFPVTKLALRDATPAAFAFGRFLLATVLVSPHLFRASPDAWKRGSVLGFLLATGFVLQSTSLGLTAAGRVAFIGSLYLLIVPLLLYLLHRTAPDRWNLLGAAIAIAGIALLTRGATGSSFNDGDLLSLACAVTFAVHLVATGTFARQVDVFALVSTQIATACLFTGLALPFIGPVTLTPTPRLLALMGYQALFTSIIALRLQLNAQRVISPSTTALILMLQPPFAAAFAFLLIGEHLTGTQWAGGAVILLGTQIPELMRRKPAT
jgi:drug/metabolite transporter (DMT)-like permease